jgi:hypothetical protein
MAPNPRLPDKECFECPNPDNRFLEHVRTVPRRSPGSEDSIVSVAIFRCSRNPTHVKEEEVPDDAA